MKIVLEIDDLVQEDEIVFRCKEMSEEILSLQKLVQESLAKKREICVLDQEKEYFLSLKQVLFFETSGREIMAHTADKSYCVKYKLYELEKLLPDFFVKVSKSTIVNVYNIGFVSRNIATTGMIGFVNSYKEVSVSRMYHKNLKYALIKMRG